MHLLRCHLFLFLFNAQCFIVQPFKVKCIVNALLMLNVALFSFEGIEGKKKSVIVDIEN